MTSVWDERAEAYRQSPTHAAGPDLDLLLEWAGDGTGRTALDVATGGGHLARRLEEAGFQVTSIDPSPAMRPTVVSRAEELPFADASFDLVANRLAAHHFADPQTAVREMARVSRGQVLLQDMVYIDDRVEEAETIRDPSHVRSYTEEEWRGLAAGAGLAVEEAVRMHRPMDLAAWLARTGCEGEDAERCTALLAHRVQDGKLTNGDILLRLRKAA